MDKNVSIYEFTIFSKKFTKIFKKKFFLKFFRKFIFLHEEGVVFLLKKWGRRNCFVKKKRIRNP